MPSFSGFYQGSAYRFLTETTPSSTSSSASVTLLSSVLVPAYTYDNGDVITVEALFRKTGNLGTSSIYFYFNTSNSLTGAVVLGSRTNNTSTVVALPLHRRMAIISASGSGNGTLCYPTTSNYSDMTISTASRTIRSINWQAGVYIIAAALVANASDNIRCDFLKVSNY